LILLFRWQENWGKQKQPLINRTSHCIEGQKHKVRYLSLNMLLMLKSS